MNMDHHRTSHDHKPPKSRRRDWRRVHHSPLFWVGVAMFLVAAAIYVASEDLSWRPHVSLLEELTARPAGLT